MEQSKIIDTLETYQLVAQGYSQVEGLDFGETFAPVVHLESIRVLLAYVVSMVLHYIKWM